MTKNPFPRCRVCRRKHDQALTLKFDINEGGLFVIARFRLTCDGLYRCFASIEAMEAWKREARRQRRAIEDADRMIADPDGYMRRRERISKLEAPANDPSATPGEVAAAHAAIERTTERK